MRSIWFQYLDVQNNRGIRFRRRLRRGNLPVIDLREEDKRIISEKNIFDNYFKMNTKEEEVDEYKGYVLEVEKITNLPLNVKKFNQIMEQNRNQIRYGKPKIVTGTSAAEKADKYTRRKRNAKEQLKKEIIQEEEEEEEEEQSKKKKPYINPLFPVDVETLLAATENSSNEESGENDDEEMPDIVEVEDDVVIEEEVEEEEEIEILEIDFYPSAVVNITQELLFLDNIPEQDSSLTQMYAQRAKQLCMKFKIQKYQFDIDGLPRFCYSPCFIILGAYMIGEVVLPSDISKMIEESEYPFFDYAIAYNHFNAYKMNFICRVSISIILHCIIILMNISSTHLHQIYYLMALYIFQNY